MKLKILPVAVLLLFLPSLNYAQETTMSAQNIQARFAEYKIDGADYQSTWVAAKDNKQGVLLIPSWIGINDYVSDEARRLAQQGHSVMIVDIFGKGIKPANNDEAKQLSDPMVADRSLARKRIGVALAEIRKRLPKGAKVAAVGYSFGGLIALELARHGADIKGTVSIWGVLDSPEADNTRAINNPVLILHGSKDIIAPLDSVSNFAQQMDAHHKAYEIVLYGGAGHAFTNPRVGADPQSPLRYDAQAANKAEASLDRFLAGIFAE